MAVRESAHPLMRLAQRVADVAAVAQARYGLRFAEERGRLGRPAPRAGEGPARPVPASDRADAATPGAAGGGSENHEESRQKIGDSEAPPAPREANSLPDPCRHHVVPHGFWPTFKELFRRFGQDQCGTYAAALSFFSILSIFPMLLVALAALAYLLHDPHEAMVRLQNIIASILPAGTAMKNARDVMAQANVEKSVTTLIQTRGIAGVIGLLSLIWASLQIFVNGAPAMNAAFEVQETRGWIKLRLVALGLLIGAGALFLLSLLPSSGPEFVRRLHLPWLGLPKHVPWYINALFDIVALAINVTMFALIYRFLPNARTTWRQCFVGGLVAGILWEAAKKGFSYYLANFGHYDKVYGTLGGLIILILWIYYTSMILLLGAETASLYQDLQQSATVEGHEHAAPRRSAPAASRDRARA